VKPILLGRQGEALAVSMLRRRGYRILGKNVRAKFGEIDLVAQDGKTLCFVEIKTRSSTHLGYPEEGVSSEKRQRLARLAQWYLLRYRKSGPIRFDVVSILLGPDGHPARTRLIQAAFDV
jgi:putative endonuclease